MRLTQRFPSVPLVVPFILYIALLGVAGLGWVGPGLEYSLRIVLVVVSIALLSREVLPWPPSRPIQTILLGAVVFAIWIAPDAIWPSYRNHWLFHNALLGTGQSSLSISLRSSIGFLALRFFGTAIVVPVVEELFWRGWLMRYLIDANFTAVPLGTYSRTSFWVTVLLFASEHGPFWEVGIIAGIAYNWWMVRTKNLADCILAHAVTNALLAVYVIAFDQWQYWL